MSPAPIYNDGLVEVPVPQLTRFLRFIAAHDLWDELEQHLASRRCTSLLMSFEPVKAIGAIVEGKAAAARKARGAPGIGASADVAGARKPDDQTDIRCGCNGPLGPRPGPISPGGGGPDAGPDGGSHPQ